MSEHWSVYIVRSSLGHLYTGITTDVTRRVQQHNDGKGAKALRGKAPIELLWTQVVGDRSYASRVEALIKRQSRRQKSALVDGRVQLSQWLVELDRKVL